MSMSVLHCELRYEIDRSGSPDRDGDRHIDIASDRIRVQADRTSTLDDPFSGLLVDASHGDGKRGGQLKASCLISTKVDAGDEVESVFAKLVQLQIGALVVGADTFFTNRSEKLAALAIRHAIPTIYQTREFAMAGGLMSYGGELRELYRLAGVYTGRILKGEKPT